VTARGITWRQAGWHLLFAGTSIVMLYPLLWMISSSLKNMSEIFNSQSLIPTEWVFSNYARGWAGFPTVSFASFFTNSFIICALVVIGNVASGSLVAFAFARLRFALRTFWFAVLLVSMMLPGQVTLIPQYVLFHKLHWVNTYLPLTVPSFLGSSAFFVFLIVQFVRGIPRELDEAATIDGCSTFQVYWRIIMPLCGPALITTGIFSFIWTWDDFFSQLIYINDVKKYTVPLGLRLFLDNSGKSDWGPMLAMSVVSLLPNFVIFLTCQKYFVQGIVTSGLKG